MVRLLIIYRNTNDQVSVKPITIRSGKYKRHANMTVLSSLAFPFLIRPCLHVGDFILLIKSSSFTAY